jgi:rod shape-determining protein MreC
MRTQKEIRQRAPLWFAAALIINFALMTIDARDRDTSQRLIRVWAQAIISPFQYATTGIGSSGVGLFQHIANLRSAAAENEQLRARVAELENEMREARSARDENRRLETLLNLREANEYQIVPARVIARDPSAWFGTLTVNRGSRAGIETGMPVVTPEGIVGRVITVSPWTSQVMLITHERAGAGAVVGQLGASNALGAIKGLGRNNLLEMNYVSGLEEVSEGDYVTTTGQDRIYPPGLNVGQVVSVERGTATVTHKILIRPGANLDSLQTVAVLLYRPPER